MAKFKTKLRMREWIESGYLRSCLSKHSQLEGDEVDIIVQAASFGLERV